MPTRYEPQLNLRLFRARLDDKGARAAAYAKNRTIFAQGDPADAVFHIQKGRVKLSVVSRRGKEAVIGILGTGDFFGEGCIASQPLRMATATTLSDSSIVRLEKARMNRLLRQDPDFAEVFLSHVLTRSIRLEDDLIDQLFNSSEKRLARVLLLLANFGKDGNTELVVPRISQETLARIVGTTRSRVSLFMNKFRKLGLIEYNGGLKVRISLLNIINRD